MPSPPLCILGGLLFAQPVPDPGMLTWMSPDAPGDHLRRQRGERSGPRQSGQEGPGGIPRVGTKEGSVALCLEGQVGGCQAGTHSRAGLKLQLWSGLELRIRPRPDRRRAHLRKILALHQDLDAEGAFMTFESKAQRVPTRKTLWSSPSKLLELCQNCPALEEL